MCWFLDHTIKATYIDQVIAAFADGGLSSTHSDPYFDSLKPFLYVYHGRNTLPFNVKLSLTLENLVNAVTR